MGPVSGRAGAKCTNQATNAGAGLIHIARVSGAPRPVLSKRLHGHPCR